VAPPPRITSHNSGATKAILVPFGPYITQTGVGAGGANVSELYTTFTLGSSGYSAFGYDMQSPANRIADDFTVPAAQSWTVSSIQWIAYQTGASTVGTITSMNLNLWNTNPNGQLPGGQSTTGGDRWESQSWTGVYRVFDSVLAATDRALIQVTCCGRWVPVLSSGTYWLECSANGALSGTWAPVKVTAGQVPPTGAPWNGLQSVAAGAFAQVYDTGNPGGSINEPGDFLFQIEGSGGGGGLTSFCTSKTSSLGCVPTLSSSSATVSKSGAPATTLTASPVPGGPGLPGILIYSKTPPISPISTAFGFLCLGAFARAGAFPSSPGGTPGTCTGTYNWNLAAIAAGTPGILVGDTLRIQGWYRDTGFPPPGNANFSHGIEILTIVPDVGDSTCASVVAPTGSSILPTSGGEGTVLTITGSDFGTNPGDLAILLANGIGFADVTSVGSSATATDPASSGDTLSATIFKVGSTGSGVVTVIHGTGMPLPDQSITLGSGTSTSSLVHALVMGQGSNFGSFNLTPSSSNTTSVTVGSPLAGGISLDMTPLAGSSGLLYRITLKTTEFAVYQGRIDFGGPLALPENIAEVLTAHLNANFGKLGVSAIWTGTTSTSVRVSMAGAAYGGIVVAGI
jgi:hypothetical protein